MIWGVFMSFIWRVVDVCFGWDGGQLKLLALRSNCGLDEIDVRGTFLGQVVVSRGRGVSVFFFRSFWVVIVFVRDIWGRFLISVQFDFWELVRQECVVGQIFIFSIVNENFYWVEINFVVSEDGFFVLSQCFFFVYLKILVCGSGIWRQVICELEVIELLLS